MTMLVCDTTISNRIDGKRYPFTVYNARGFKETVLNLTQDELVDYLTDNGAEEVSHAEITQMQATYRRNLQQHQRLMGLGLAR